MQITKEFKINEVKATRASNAPFRIVLEGNPLRQNEESILTLDTNTCTLYNIPMSINLVGQILVCSFESHELSLKKNKSFKYVDMSSLKSDDMAICLLQRKETIFPSYGTIPSSKRREVSRILKLSSFSGNIGSRNTPSPCPFYQIVLELTDKEYGACKVLPPTSVFKVSFRLA